ncbi:MAG: SurA N-terminal domain-containing protein [Planctomycetes bacterium]|nr:SurA N-terminal domain-containing protein [Planctomycetota bacterium]
MLKLIRKNKQWLFAVLMIFLAIAFLVPNLGSNSGGGISTETVARVGEDKISAFQVARADAELAMLKEMFGPQIGDVAGVKVENGTHWLLLEREASQAGFIGNDADGKEWLDALAFELAPQQLASNGVLFEMVLKEANPQMYELLQSNPQLARDQNFLMNIAAQPQMISGATQFLRNVLTEKANQGTAKLMDAPGLKFDIHSFDAALAKLRGVRRMINAFTEAPRVSDRRLLVSAASRFNEAVASMTLLPAERLVDATMEPDAKELQAFFEKYKGDIPGQTNPNNDFGFGYRQPSRVKIEYLTLDRTVIAAAIKPDPVAAYTKWKNSRVTYAKEFADEKARVEEDLRSELTTTILNDAEKVLRAEMQRAVKKLEESGGYRVVPANWNETRPTLDAVAKIIREQIKAIHSVDIQEPLVTLKTGSWLNAEDLSKLPGIGEAAFTLAGRANPFYLVVMQTKEFATTANNWGVQQGITYPLDKTLTDKAGNRYFFTILETKPEAPAETMDEVRDQLVKDFRLFKAYEKLVADAGAYRNRVIAEGMEAFAKSFEKPNPDPVATTPLEPGLIYKPFVSVRSVGIMIDNQRLDGSNDTPALRTAVLDVATKLDPKAAPVYGAEAKGDAIKDRVVSAPNPALRGLMIAQVIAYRPLPTEMYRGLADSESRQVLMTDYQPTEQGKLNENPYLWRVIRGRLNYRPVRESTTPESKETEEEAQPIMPAN